jgi:branched-chain amino acid transport system permease protein
MFGVLNLHDRFTLYFVVTAIFLIGFLITHVAIRSAFGAQLRRVRDGRLEGSAADRYRLQAFLLSGAIAGLAGATLAFVYGFVQPQLAALATSGEGALMVLVGGIGTIFGPVVGAFAVILATQYLDLPQAGVMTIILGAAFIVFVLFGRLGIVGTIIYLVRPSDEARRHASLYGAARN